MSRAPKVIPVHFATDDSRFAMQLGRRRWTACKVTRIAGDCTRDVDVVTCAHCLTELARDTVQRLGG